jgi:hypothetical protein
VTDWVATLHAGAGKSRRALTAPAHFSDSALDHRRYNPVRAPRGGSHLVWRETMKMHNTILLSLLAVGLLTGSSAAQQKSLKDQLVGTWIVESWEQVRPDGSKFHRFGNNPKGIQIFDASGRFAIMFIAPDLPKIASNNPSTPSPEELKILTGRSIAYYGTYTVVDENAKTIDLKIEASSFPNQVTANNKRTITLINADELKYQNTTALTGGQIYIAAKRAK